MLFELFVAFAKIGLFTFGGGYAMLPLLERVTVKEKGWVTSEELMDYFAVGQCTPGVIAVNAATFIGVKIRGTAGGIAATLGVIFPSLVIIAIIALFIKQFAEYEIVRHAFLGIRIAVAALVTVSVYSLAKKAVRDIPTLFISILTFAAATFLGASPIILVLSAGVAGAVINTVKEKFND